MTNTEQAAGFSLERMKANGAEHAQVICTDSLKEELCFAHGEISMLRTTADQSIVLTALKDQRKSRISLNQLAKEKLDTASAELLAQTEAGSPDPAHGIAPRQESKEFSHGALEPDFPKMRERMKEFLAYVKGKYPSVILEEGFLDFLKSETTYLNSNGVRFKGTHGGYGMTAVFSAKEGTRTSGFNYTFGNLPDLSRPLVEMLDLGGLIEESTRQLDGKSVPDKFTGELLLTPHCLRDLVYPYLGYLGDTAMIAGTSPFKGKLGERVASPLFSLHADPRSPELVSHQFFDGDGFETVAMPLFEKGVLKNHLLSLYGANKAGLARAVANEGRLICDAGQTPRAELVRTIKRGIIMGRFSGGRPSLNGDFSGVAKNSFYVENGEIRYSLAETMVSGNLVQLFDSISGVSQERVHSGTRIFPWVLSSGVTISGK